MAETNIPVIDLSDFRSGDAAKKQHFVQQIGNAYRKVGFVAIINHGIHKDLIEEFYCQVKSFFAMDTELKSNYEIKSLAGQRGYTSFGREHAKGSDAPDLKEFWQFGPDVEDDVALINEYPPNLEVSELPQFNEIGMKLYRNFEHSGKDILSAISLYLGLEENYFDGFIHNGNSILRAIHYPPITSEPKSAIRAEQHEDINLITLLVGASAAGLQVLNSEGNWVSVNTTGDMIVVNVGDMLQRLTNNQLRSTTHRVVNPPRELWHTPRLSIPFFLHPVSKMDLTCLDSCVDGDHPKQYGDMTAGTYLKERLIEIGLLKK